jgi:UDP-N-acetylglucosamine 2-epimerase (non-hydrolysing)/GDP/UDP-N,N'-diacetylbacillosamine 2-epimerase (hydrolysing)
MHLSNKYGLTIREIEDDGISIRASVKMDPHTDDGYGMANAFAKGVTSFASIFRQIRPDINMILGDRDEAFASACAAFHMSIPNAHIHGGDSTGGIDEYIRHAITKLSNLHLAATSKSASRIVKMGENKKFIFNVGSSALDEIVNMRGTDNQKLALKYNISDKKQFILFIQHPVTTQATESEKQITQSLEAVLVPKLPVIIIGPNSDAGNSIMRKIIRKYLMSYKLLSYYDSIPRVEYLGLLSMCSVLVGNSSSGIIDAASFKKPVVNIGIRQSGRERSNNVIDVNNKTCEIISAIKKSLYNKKFKKKLNACINPYGDGKASVRIAKILSTIKLDSRFMQKKITY